MSAPISLARLGNVYEHAPRAAEIAHAARPFATVAALFAALREAVRAEPEAARLALLRAHPVLAARTGALTADSRQEQTGAGLAHLSDVDHENFRRLNEAYRRKFGFPYIVCVRRHTRDSILAGAERRLDNPGNVELATALDEVDRIAALRLAGLVEGPGPLAVHGRLSTHVLDTHAGRPAAGVRVTLRELSQSSEPRTLVETTTNDDGRTTEPLITGRPIGIGRYELVFAVGDYFSRQAPAAASEPPFLDLVPIRFGIAQPEGHYHVPLLVTPWSYSTYRGS